MNVTPNDIQEMLTKWGNKRKIIERAKTTEYDNENVKKKTTSKKGY